MNRYNPAEIEPKWQAEWAKTKLYEVTEDSSKPKAYVAGMFPYPSGAGLHVGHVRNYAIVDVIARFHRQRGFNVLNPMGWDTFGLPAENYAIKTGTPPAASTAENIKNFKNQFSRIGISIDWSRELNTSDPEYYRWTQWIFTKLFERGLAYQAERLQWWCPHDKTVLANEQVEAGKCWRCGNVVIKKSMKQWFFKITEYADELLDGIDDLDWPEGIKAMQRNWIGRSVGSEVDFVVDGSDQTVTVFTTRPDTLFGATFLVLAPEHEFVASLTTSEQKDAVENYIAEANKKSDIERQDTNREKTGVFTGSYAVNPVNNEKIPVWIADYVLTGYGTGAIMAVPAHDERDYAFAKKFELPIVEVIAADFGETLENAVDVEGPAVIGYDPATKQFMSLINNKNGMRWFAAGGLSGDESHTDAALRELNEEAGFKDVKKLIQLGGPTYSYYFNTNKQSNRRSFSYTFLAVIDANSQGEQSQEAHEDYSVSWSTADVILKDLQKEPSGRDHWIDALARAQDAAAAFDAGKEYEPPCLGGEGILFNSVEYDGMSSPKAREKIVADLAKSGKGKEQTNFRMRDWLISRQRYWGAPIPIIHCEKDGAVAIPEKDLPLILPEVTDYEPDGSGTTALGRATDWVNTTCPTCGGPAKRETDTMDGYACSSWYYLRYADPQNTENAWDKDKADYWMPIDFYCGGDHAVSHLLYSRFWTKAFADMGLLSVREPVKKLVYNGYINAPDGFKMSKSRGNVVDPLELIDAGYGADALRVYELFIAPYELDAAWDPNGIAGTHRFLNRVWNLVHEYLEAQKPGEAPLATVHKTIKKVTGDLERLSFNTAIAAQMELVNELYKSKTGGLKGESWQFTLEALVKLVAPFAPHIADELWQLLGHEDSVHTALWPTWDEALLVEDTVTIVVQVNGKVRAELVLLKDASKEDIETAALSNDRVKEFVGNKKPARVIVVPGRLVNIVT